VLTSTVCRVLDAGPAHAGAQDSPGSAGRSRGCAWARWAWPGRTRPGSSWVLEVRVAAGAASRARDRVELPVCGQGGPSRCGPRMHDRGAGRPPPVWIGW